MKSKCILLFLFCPIFGIAQSLDYSSYSSLLKECVSETGAVDYAKLKDHLGELKSIVAYLAKQEASSGPSPSDQLSYWINVYNANTLILITEHYPINSIKDLDGGKPWDVIRVKAGHKVYSLNQIENEIIRPVFKDPRIHFALNCGARSCPPLLNKAYLPADLDQTLDNQVKKFIRSFKKDSSGKLIISTLFDWYKTDFGDAIRYINRFATSPYPARQEISFAEYDWRLNDSK